MTGRRRNNGRGRGRGRMTRRGGAGPSGKTFSPPSIPPSFAAPQPLHTQVEFTVDVSKELKTFTTLLIGQAIAKQYGLNPSDGVATQSFSYRMLSVMAWMIPNLNDTAFGELTVQFLDPPASGAATLRQIKGYGSRDRAARVGFTYPTAVQQLPVQSNSNFSWVRVKNDGRSPDQAVLFRVKVVAYLFGGDVLQPSVEEPPQLDPLLFFARSF